MQTIFKIIDPGNESDRVPGVFLIPSEIPALSIRCKSDSNVNALTLKFDAENVHRLIFHLKRLILVM